MSRAHLLRMTFFLALIATPWARAAEPGPAPASKPPITLKEFDALSRRAPVQGTDAQRQAFEKEVAAFGDSLKGRAIADRVALSSVSEAPKSSGKPKTWTVLCGPTRDPAQRLAVLLRTTSDKASDMTPGTEFSFTGKVEGARYDAMAMMVIVLVGDAAIQ